jgi:hypothetical protein
MSLLLALLFACPQPDSVCPGDLVDEEAVGAYPSAEEACWETGGALPLDEAPGLRNADDGSLITELGNYVCCYPADSGGAR